LKAHVEQLNQLNQQWGELTMKVGMAAMKNPDEVGAAAVDYLMYSGYIILAYLWLRMAIAAQSHDDAAFAQAKLATCDFYFKRLLPRTATHRAAVEAGSECLMSLPAQLFAL
ncbi:acyl-CoA dehydrogenase C-terminal domain-containing protein, partial [Pseudomonas syringae]|uniref:acyl-CoA dehydrogenase C-terminal domain-containing protein n=2 Tax=Pseudomonas TaxID=286 RepID=UPI001F21C921